MRRALIGLALALAACGGSDARATCTCTPHAVPAAASAKLLALIQRHAAAVRAGERNGRDTKLIDDELREQTRIACAPCGRWIDDRATPEDLYPIARAATATAVVCGGLVLADGTTVYADARPAECR